MSHIPGHVGTTDDSGGSGSTLADLIGREVIDWSDRASGILRMFTSQMGNPIYWLDSGQQGGIGRQFTTGARLFDPVTRNLYSVGSEGRTTTTKLSDADLRRAGLGGFVESGSAPSTRSAPAYSSTQAAQSQAEAFAAEQARLGREATAEQSRLDREQQERLEAERRENAIRQGLIREVSSLAQAAAAIRQRYSESLGLLEQRKDELLSETLGKDVVRGAIMSQGGVQRGRTPMESQRSGLMSRKEDIAGRREALTPLPTVDLSASTEGLRAQLEEFRGLSQPYDLSEFEEPVFEEPAIGLAQGGVIDMQQDGSSDALTVNGRQVGKTGGVGFSVLVGEEGGFTGDEEVLNFDESGRLEDVRPLAGGAAHGASFDYDLSTVEQALSPAYDALGFSEIPTLSRTPRTRSAPQGRGLVADFGGGGVLAGLSSLGVSPRLLRDASSGENWLIDTSGQRRLVSEDWLRRGGFNLDERMNLSASEILQLAPERGSNRWAPDELSLIEPGVSERRFPRRSSPLSVHFPDGEELLMPAPRAMASLWRTLSVPTRAVISSALRVAGMSDEEAQRERQAYTPRGTARAGLTYG